MDAPVSYESVIDALANHTSFYFIHPRKDEVVLYLTDSFIQDVAPSMGSASNKPIESLAIYLKNAISPTEHFIHFGKVDEDDAKNIYYRLDKADYHIILDGQNRYQIIRQVLTKLIKENFKIDGKKINNIYIETLSYLHIPNIVCDTAFKIRNRSMSCDWFDEFPQSNVNKRGNPQPLNRNKKRIDSLARREIKKCGLGPANNPSPFNNIKDEVAAQFDCQKRQAH